LCVKKKEGKKKVTSRKTGLTKKNTHVRGPNKKNHLTQKNRENNKQKQQQQHAKKKNH